MDASKTTIDLAGERQVAIRDRGIVYRFTLQPVTAERWMKYFEGIESSSETRGREQVNTLDVSSALLTLVGGVLTNASGYKVAGDQITALENWQQKIPMGHRLAIGQVLASATASSEDSSEAMELGDRAIELEALWNVLDDGATMMLHRPLVHKFREPSFDHERRYRRDSSRSKVIGGSRTGKTVWMGAQPTLIKIYDDLIQAVDGYCYGSDDLSARGHIVQYMDAYHKVVAARQLFAQAEV